jgi:hypothetical protein
LKRAVFAIMVFMFSTSAFALDLSAGFTLSTGIFINRMIASSSSLGVSSELTNTSIPFRGEAFFDGQYFQFGLGYRLRVLGHQKQTLTVSGTTSTLTDADTGLKGYLALSLYLKYPLVVGRFVIFPLLGVEKDLNVVIHDASGHDLLGKMTDQQRVNEDQVWVKTGMGVQFPLSSWGYLRTQILFGWKVPNQSENDAVANAESAGFDATLYSFEPDLSIAVGFKL